MATEQIVQFNFGKATEKPQEEIKNTVYDFTGDLVVDTSNTLYDQIIEGMNHPTLRRIIESPCFKFKSFDKIIDSQYEDFCARKFPVFNRLIRVYERESDRKLFDYQINAIREATFSDYISVKIEVDKDEKVEKHTVIPLSMKPRQGPSVSLFDSSPGTGKTITSLLSALFYTIINSKKLKRKYQTKCMTQSDNIIFNCTSLEYREIIAICVPIHLYSQWKFEIECLVHQLYNYVKNCFGKKLTHEFLVNVDCLRDNIGKNDEVCFLLFKENKTSIKKSILISQGDATDNPSRKELSFMKPGVHLSYPVLIGDEAHNLTLFSKPLPFGAKFLLNALHYMAISATFDLVKNPDIKENSLNGYICGYYPCMDVSKYLWREENTVSHLLTLLLQIRFDSNLMVEQIEDVYKRQKIRGVVLHTKQTLFHDDEFAEFNDIDTNFQSFREFMSNHYISIPPEFKNSFTKNKFNEIVNDQLKSLSEDTTRNEREITRQRNKMIIARDKILSPSNDDECAICREKLNGYECVDENCMMIEQKEEDDEVVFNLCCFNRFHRNCIQQWNGGCPYCRKDSHFISTSVCASCPEKEKDSSNDVVDLVFEDDSIKSLRDFIDRNPFFHNDNISGYSIRNRVYQIISSLNFYVETFPQKQLKLMLICESRDLGNIVDQIRMDFSDKNVVTKLHVVRGNRSDPMTRKKITENIASIHKDYTGKVFLFCVTDYKTDDSMTGLDFGLLDGLFLVGTTDDRGQEEQQLGRILRVKTLLEENNDKILIRVNRSN